MARRSVDPQQLPLSLQIDELDFIRAHMVAGMTFEEAQAELVRSYQLEIDPTDPNGEDDGE